MKQARYGFVVLFLAAGLAASAGAGEIGFIEDFALSANREDAIKQLIPGSEDCYYYQCLDFQNSGRYDKVNETLAAWIKRHGHTGRVEEIRNRQALLNYEKDPKATLGFLKTQMALTFNHEREIMGQKPTHPTSLDQNMISRETLKARAFANRGDLSGFEDTALEFLISENLNGDRRRDMLRRLQRPDYPNLVKLVNDDLDHQHSPGFGAFEIHRKMLLAQLDELLKVRPGILNEANFVNVYLSKLHPGPDVDWQRDPKAREAYLDTLWVFVQRLDPVHNSLKALVLYQRLTHDRALGVYDKSRFMEYIKLPRSVHYINRDYITAPANRENPANLQADFRAVTLCPPIMNDEALVRDYLMSFFLKEDTFAPYSPYLLDTYLKEVFAETKILNGLGDMEKWYSLLNNPAKYQEIKDRIEVEFAPTDKTFFRPDEPVSLDVDVKNVKTLIVKVFEINTMNYYREQMREIDTGLDLDGLVAGDEKTYTYSDAPARRVRRHFDFPALNKRGVFVVEFIGNGKSSRALVRKGQFTFLEQSTPAGHVFIVLDENNRTLQNASIWLSGHEYKADKEGEIAVPYSTSPGRQSVLVSCDGFTTFDHFGQDAESYSLNAGFYVDRESLLKRAKAKVLVRPTLTINGIPAALPLLEEPSLLIQSTDIEGVSSTKEVKDVKLVADGELAYEFKVPENAVQIGFTLKGRVQSLSQNKKVDLSASRTFSLNQIDAGDKVDDLHLSRAPEGYVLQLLGKTGEPKPDRPVTLRIKHRDFRQQVDALVQTDASGRINLGALKDVASFAANSPEGVAHSWSLPRQDNHTYFAAVHGRVGEKLLIPYMGKANEAEPGLFSLLEVRTGTYVANWFKTLVIADGFLEISGLPAGSYDLLMKETGTRTTINVTEGDAREGYALGANRLLEIRNPAPLQISAVSADDKDLKIRVRNADDFTRVHVFATRFRPAFSAFAELTRPLVEPGVVTPAKFDSVYVSGRDIGDEYRYVLERKYAVKYPGNMLTRPSLLLNPWVLRKTETGAQQAEAGTAMPSAMAGLGASRSAGGIGGRAQDRPADGFANLDFLPAPSAVLANLRPGKDGLVTITRKDLGEGQDVHVVAVNPDNVVCRELVLPEVKLVPRDLRLAAGLDPAKHFTEQKKITPIGPDSKLVLDDITTSKIETYDSIGKVYRLFSTLSGDATLAEFGFITAWPNLKPEEQREKYSKYACHELNFFLCRKDPKFFESAILPALKNKKDKTFLDRWLIGDDIRDYLKPKAYEGLNIVERILLAQRIKEEAPAAARHLKDLQDLIPPDLDRLNQLFLTAIKGSALETGGAGDKFEQARDMLGEKNLWHRIADADAAKPGGFAMETREDGTGTLDSVAADPAMVPAETPPPAAPAPMVTGSRAAKLTGKSRALRGTGEKADKESMSELLEKRADGRQLYRKLDKTQELAENNYYHQPIENQNAALVTVNPFWTDYANYSGKEPFSSPRVAEASRSFTEMMFALAVLDLPFEAKEADATYEGAKMTLAAKSPLIAYHKEIKESAPDKTAPPLLVSQNFFRASDRYRFENGERFDKYVTEEFLTHVVYGCQVVLTDPTSSPLKLDLLMQIPRGAIPVNRGLFTRSVPVRMEPYSTTTFEYYFYFPAPGAFGHFPVHVSRNGQLVGSAPAVAMKVVDTPTKIDTTSWDYVSQNGTPEETLKFLDTDNPNRLNLERIAWRMHDKEFFAKATDLLSRRHVYNHTLWSYGIYNDVPAAIGEFLLHSDGFLNQCGDYLACQLLTIDPIVRKSYQHLEYSPLVNARAHQLGKRRQIVNEQMARQYHALLKVLGYKQDFDNADLLSVVYYLLLQDRIDDAKRFFGNVKRTDTAMQIQHDYLQAYLDFYSEDRKLARSIAAKYSDYPVDRWRNVFREVVTQLDEIEGKAASVVDKENRDQLMAKLAATEGGFEFSVESRKITVNCQNLASATVNYYLMDVELLFSRNPFVKQEAGQFAWIRPNRTDAIKFPAGGKSTSFDLPKEFQNANVMVEIVATGARKALPHFANSLAVQVIENYGQVKVANLKTGAPLPKVYVKVYARMKDGATQFYKDGYTDLRGRFDYTSLNTSDLENVEKFSLLILSETDGAVIREATTPKQ